MFSKARGRCSVAHASPSHFRSFGGICAARSRIAPSMWGAPHGFRLRPQSSREGSGSPWFRPRKNLPLAGRAGGGPVACAAVPLGRLTFPPAPLSRNHRLRSPCAHHWGEAVEKLCGGARQARRDNGARAYPQECEGSALPAQIRPNPVMRRGLFDLTWLWSWLRRLNRQAGERSPR